MPRSVLALSSALALALALALAALALAPLGLSLAGCSGGAAFGEACHRHSDCAGAAQCAQRVCAPLCEHTPDCGDGYACDDRGFCIPATGELHEACLSEGDCRAGLSCQIVGIAARRTLAQCEVQPGGTPAGGACAADADCRNGTCALGRCVDLCSSSRDCAAGASCAQIPYVDDPDPDVATPGVTFSGCLPASGVVTWTLPAGPSVLWPVPSGATQASLVISTAPPRTAAAVQVAAPSRSEPLFQLCPQYGDFTCDAAAQRAQYYTNRTRHRPEVGQAVLAMPSTSLDPLETNALYTVLVRSFYPDGSEGPPPTVTAVVRLGGATRLDLHLHFLDLSDHPCGGAFTEGRLDAAAAATDVAFQEDYLKRLREIFKESGAITLGDITYEDVARPDLDGLELARVGELLALGRHAAGVDVFFVRDISPAGVQAYAPSPGPAGLAGTPRSGIVVSVDTLCFRKWSQLARITAHELARYMGLHRNVELDGHRDGIIDNDDPSNPDKDNLMFYSELGGDALSPGQREILLRSPALR